MFATVRKLVCLFKADGSFEGYTDSEGNTFSGEREEGFTIVDKFSGVGACCPACDNNRTLTHSRMNQLRISREGRPAH